MHQLRKVYCMMRTICLRWWILCVSEITRLARVGYRVVAQTRPLRLVVAQPRSIPGEDTRMRRRPGIAP